MKKKLNSLLFLSIIPFSLSACELFTTSKDEKLTQVNEAELAKWQDAGEGTFYKSDLYDMHCTIAGYFTYGRPFTLGETENIHIYNNLCLYEGDEFFIAKNKSRNQGSFLPNFDYCFKLKDESDTQYVTIDSPAEDPTCGSLFVNQGKDGVYKITFDTETQLIDLEYLSEIETPKYDVLSGVDIQNIHDSSDKKTTRMRENPDNPDEICVLGYSIPMYASIIFPNNLGCYTRVWLDASYVNTARTFTKRELLRFSRGGVFNVYLNTKTYVVRLEQLDYETAKYNCYYIFVNDANPNGDALAMTQDAEHPYIYHLDNFSNRKELGFISTIRFVDIEPNERGTYKYVLEPTNTNISRDDNNGYFFTVGGTFNITINLKEGTLDAQKID